MAVGLRGSATAAPGWSVDAVIGVSVRLPKLPTNTCPDATARVCGPGPTGIGGLASIVETSIGVTCLLPKAATNAVTAPVAAAETAMATGCVPTGIGGPARQLPRSTGVTLSEPRL